MQRLKEFIGISSSDQINEASEWVYEYCFSNDKATGPYTLDQLVRSGDRFQGRGKDEGKRDFEFIGEIQGDQFKIKQVHSAAKAQDKIIEGHIKQEGTLVGKWCYAQDGKSAKSKGDFVIRKVSNFVFALSDKCPEYLKLSMENIPCKCNTYYTCGKCTFLICYQCFFKIQYMQKSELISIILNHSQKKDVTENAEYIRGIYRKVFCDDERAKSSVMKRKGRDYRWFEVYYLDENSLEFKRKENIELYIDQQKFAEGHFHEVKLCKQSRRIDEIRNPNEQPIYREIDLNPEVNWAIKQVKKKEHMDEVPNDIAKQYLAKTLADNFNILLKTIYPKETVYMMYIQPFIVLPLFEIPEHHYFFEMESFMETDKKFLYFNRPGQELKVVDEKLGQARLPSAFTHWTYAASGKRFMITDVQGWRIDKGQYILTDPIVFSPVPDQLGLVDWGSDGMESWMKKHVCNDVCKDVPMVEDQNLINQCLGYMEKFKSKNESFYKQLEVILGGLN
ncbi:protein serine threonine kinase [Stylonychia lemnae]|uniref:Protein serine threonine kinase n=1 Tax=Stylonychia lemnae TaxID=5949 RepID=A0A077ZXR5_STYLE|nr:protein serine threonine kinase [Stylonychia lemnae]|eukprot:CDW73316.1 protein serine threonine kinase [Stylonychia lemnae]